MQSAFGSGCFKYSFMGKWWISQRWLQLLVPPNINRAEKRPVFFCEVPPPFNAGVRQKHTPDSERDKLQALQPPTTKATYNCHIMQHSSIHTSLIKLRLILGETDVIQPPYREKTEWLGGTETHSFLLLAHLLTHSLTFSLIHSFTV